MSNNRQWQAICDRIARTGPIGRFWVNHVLSRLVVNTPVVLLYVTLCVIVYPIVHYLNLEHQLTVHSGWNPNSIQCHTAMLTHMITHRRFADVRENLTALLLVGPSVERSLGSLHLLWLMLVVALGSATAHMLVVGHDGPALQGASAIVLACILMHSMESANKGQIPVSFFLTAILFLGDDIYHLVYKQRDLRTPLVLWTGAVVGAVMGWTVLRRPHMGAPTKKQS